MTERGLPEGLIESNTNAVSEEIDSTEHVNVEDIARLWRAYSTNKQLIANGVGQRLENFFWRIWASGKVRSSLRGSHVARLFLRISEAKIIRTTPTASPRSSRLLSRTPLDLPPSPQAGSSSPTQAAWPGKLTHDEPTQPPTIEEEKGRRRSSARPPAILKKPGIESASKKTATILTPTWKTVASDPLHDEAESTDKSPAKPSSLSFVESAIADDEASSPVKNELTSLKSPTSSKPTKKKTSAFVVGGGGGSSKRRPALGRRKSSQSSSGGNSKVPSPNVNPSLSPPNALAKRSTAAAAATSTSSTATTSYLPLNPPLPVSPVRRPTSRSASPVSSSPFKRPPRDHLPIQHSGRAFAETETQRNSAPQDWLVDRNFRGSFVDKVRSHSGNSSTSSMKSTATSRFSTSFHAQGSLTSSLDEKKNKGKGMAGSIEEEEDLSALTLEKLPSQVFEDEDDDESGARGCAAPIPRAASQLSLLLKGGSTKNGGSSSSIGKGKGKEKAKEKEKKGSRKN